MTLPASPIKRATRFETAFTFVEVMAATAILGFVGASIYWGLAGGNVLIQSTREDLRATQIMLQKLEAIRLFTWSQVGDTNNYLTSNFIEYYDPSGVTNSSSGVKYRCYVSAATPAVGATPAATSAAAVNTTPTRVAVTATAVRVVGTATPAGRATPTPTVSP